MVLRKLVRNRPFSVVAIRCRLKFNKTVSWLWAYSQEMWVIEGFLQYAQRSVKSVTFLDKNLWFLEFGSEAPLVQNLKIEYNGHVIDRGFLTSMTRVKIRNPGSFLMICDLSIENTGINYFKLTALHVSLTYNTTLQYECHCLNYNRFHHIYTWFSLRWILKLI